MIFTQIDCTADQRTRTWGILHVQTCPDEEVVSFLVCARAAASGLGISGKQARSCVSIIKPCWPLRPSFSSHHHAFPTSLFWRFRQSRAAGAVQRGSFTPSIISSLLSSALLEHTKRRRRHASVALFLSYLLDVFRLVFSFVANTSAAHLEVAPA